MRLKRRLSKRRRVHAASGLVIAWDATVYASTTCNMKGGSDVWRNDPMVAGSSVRANPSTVALRIPQLVETRSAITNPGGTKHEYRIADHSRTTAYRSSSHLALQLRVGILSQRRLRSDSTDNHHPRANGTPLRARTSRVRSYEESAELVCSRRWLIDRCSHRFGLLYR